MIPNVTAKNINIGEQTKDFIEKKFKKLDRYKNYITHCELTLYKEGHRYVSECYIHLTKKPPIVAKVTETDLIVAIQKTADKTINQIKKIADKIHDRTKK